MKVYKNTVIGITAVSFLGKCLGFVREIIIAYFWGTSYIVDAYITAASIGGILFGWLISVATCFTPVYINQVIRNGDEAGNSYTGNIIAITGSVAVLAAGFILLFKDNIVDLVAPGFSTAAHDLTVHYLSVSILSLVVIPVNQILRAYLESNHYFIKASLPDLSVSLVQMIFIFIAGLFDYRIFGLALICPYVVQLILLLSMAKMKKHGVKIKIKLTKGVKETFILLIPVFISSMVTEINVLADKVFASSLQAGSLSSLNYAVTVRDIILNISMVALLTISFPKMSKFAAKSDSEHLNESILQGLKYIFMFIIPLSLGLGILSKQTIGFIYIRGSFDELSFRTTWVCYIVYLTAMVPLAIQMLAMKLFYALKEMRIPLYISIISVIINIIGNFFLVKRIGVLGLAISTAFSVIIVLPILLYSLIKLLNVKEKNKIFTTLRFALKCSMSAVLMTAGIYFFVRSIPIELSFFALIAVLAVALAGIVIYLFLLHLFKVEEVKKVDDLIYKFFNIK